MSSNQTNSKPPPAAHAPDAATAEELLFPALPYDLKSRATHALKTVQLQQFVNSTTLLKDNKRKQEMPEAFGENVDAIRQLAGDIKQHTLDHLDHYIEKWVDNATQAGVTVHFAKDDKQANAIAIDIAQENDCKLCVKSKSMVTEETHLVPALEAAGCETVETDLGEFILQLDGDAPSHIVTPMIHKDRTAVARAFVRELGVEYTEDPDKLAAIARKHLREKYRRADLGISGGNFLLADTGGLVLCTNEGNGRFCTSAPRIHVAFVGIEKLIPRQEHLAVMLKVLSRSSSGQAMTCYTHIMTGPKRDHEPDGPEQLHVVLIDNGRTEVLKEETREMLRCIRCGACLNACPVFRKIGGHSYGSVYPGPIGAILTPVLKGLANYHDLPHASSLCGACYEACPVKINIPKYLVKLREEMVGQRIATPSERWVMRLWARALGRSWSHRLGGWSQARAFRLLARFKGGLGEGGPYAGRGWVRIAPGPMSGWTSQRDLPTPTSKSFRHWWQYERGETSTQQQGEGKSS